jgi:hypothetical protein
VTPAGWVFLCGGWALVIGLAGYCVLRLWRDR